MDEIDYEVAGILIEIPYLIAMSESSSRSEFSVKWGAKRKRSDVLPCLQSQPSVPVAVVGGPTPTTYETEKEKPPKAPSPTTPLLFSPSESDEKTKQRSNKNVSLKRKKEDYLKMEVEWTKSNRIMKEEIKKIRSYYDQEKALNLKLKAAMEDRIRAQSSLNRAMASTSTSTQPAVQERQYMDQTTHNIGTSQCRPPLQGQTQNISFSSSNGGGLFMINDNNNNQVGPSHLPLDLNIPLLEEDSFTAKKEEARALAAQARQRRIQIWRSKARINKLRSHFTGR